jgi:hypothetical protein
LILLDLSEIKAAQHKATQNFKSCSSPAPPDGEESEAVGRLGIADFTKFDRPVSKAQPGKIDGKAKQALHASFTFVLVL